MFNSFSSRLNLTITSSQVGAGLPPTVYTPFPPLMNTANGCGWWTFPLTAGNNDSNIAVPLGTKYYVLVPDSASTNAKTISQQPATFNGILFTNQPLLLPVGPGQQFLYIYSVGADLISVYWL